MARAKVICIDRHVCQDTIRPEVTAALNRALGELGLKASIGNITFTNTTAKTRLTITVDGVDVDRQEFNRHCIRFGLVPTDYGRAFKYLADDFKLVGIKPTSRRYPLVAQRLRDAKRFKLPASAASCVKV